MLLIGEKRAKPLKDFFDSLNDVVLKMVDLIMLSAPVAVFALLANVVVSSGDSDITSCFIKICRLLLVLGLLLIVTFYSFLVAFFTKKNPFWFLKQISPAQLLAFSTSSQVQLLYQLLWNE